MPFLALFGNPFVRYALLVIVAISAYGAWSYHMQKVGADKFQIEIQTKEAAQDRLRLASLSDRLKVAKAAQAKAGAESRRFQEALLHDKETVDWVATCGKRQLPNSVCAYVTGLPTCAGGGDAPAKSP